MFIAFNPPPMIYEALGILPPHPPRASTAVWLFCLLLKLPRHLLRKLWIVVQQQSSNFMPPAASPNHHVGISHLCFIMNTGRVVRLLSEVNGVMMPWMVACPTNSKATQLWQQLQKLKRTKQLNILASIVAFHAHLSLTCWWENSKLSKICPM